jgi:uroporphyrin-III C-methyltransferase/precorrin-2 dehydrogenase/sirohydrochlorin ferrochelatase
MRGQAPNLPVFLDLRGAKVVVVGGDSASAAKAKAYAECGARVTLLSTQPGPEALALAAPLFGVRLRKRGWLFSDLIDAALVCAGPRLPDGALERLAGAASACEARFYAIDRPAFSDFSSGAAITRGAVSIGIATAGAAPALGQALRREIERLLPDEVAPYVAAAAALRAEAHQKLQGLARRRFWADSADSALAAMQGGDAPKDEQGWRAWLVARLNGAPTQSAAHIALVRAPAALDALTLGEARALSRADVAFIAQDAPQACLSLLRREAERRPLPKAKSELELQPGAFAVIVAGPNSLQQAQALIS